MNEFNPAVVAMRQAASGEGFAYTIYTIFAAKLRESGYAEAAMLISEMAENEKEHMEQWLERIGAIPKEDEMLDTAAGFEDNDAEVMYTKMMQLKGIIPDDCIELASRLKAIEEHHREMCRALSKNYNQGSQEGVTTKYMWICPHCGNMYESEDEIPAECPVCKHSKSEYVYRETVVKCAEG